MSSCNTDLNWLREYRLSDAKGMYYVHLFGVVILILSIPVLIYFHLYIAPIMLIPWIFLNAFGAVIHKRRYNYLKGNEQ